MKSYQCSELRMMRAIVKEENERERCEVFKEGSMNDSSVPN